MIYVYLYGRLGNCMAQIGAAASLANYLGTEFAAFITDYMCPTPDFCPLKEYLIPYRKTIFRNVPFVDDIPVGCREIMESAAIQEWSQLEIAVNEDVILNGYFLNPSLLNRDLCRELFSIPDSLRDELVKRYNITHDTGCVVVRRGDYMELPQYFAICGERYYKKGINYLEKHYGVKKWLIIGDDEEWLKKTFRDEKYTIVHEPPLEDMYLNTLVQYIIISNSTFAWWGAYLNGFSNQRVINPKPWYGMSYRKMEDGAQKRFCKLPNWIAMENSNPYQRMRGYWKYLKNGITKRIKRLKW